MAYIFSPLDGDKVLLCSPGWSQTVKILSGLGSHLQHLTYTSQKVIQAQV